MKIAIVGAGGVGGHFGARLAAAGENVHFVARGRHLAAMQRSGLVVESPLGRINLERPQATDDPRSIGTVDLVLLCVKLWDMQELLPTLTPLLGPDTAVLSLQNGVVKDEILTKAFGSAAVLGGVCYIASSIESPGVIRHAGKMQRLVIGEYSGATTPRVLAFKAACERAGIDVSVESDVTRAIWEKFVFLVGFSGSTTATGHPIGVVRSVPETRELLYDLMNETVTVARAMGVALPPYFAADRLAFCDALPPDMTSSMHHDRVLKNRLEVPWLSGDVVAKGKRLKIDTPANRAVAAILMPDAGGHTGSATA